MNEDTFKGYRGAALEILKKFDAHVWSDAVIKTCEGAEFVGRILPRSITSDDKHIVVKLSTG